MRATWPPGLCSSLTICSHNRHVIVKMTSTLYLCHGAVLHGTTMGRVHSFINYINALGMPMITEVIAHVQTSVPGSLSLRPSPCNSSESERMREPGDEANNTNALSCTNFVAIVGAGQLVAMAARGWAWLIARILGCAL